MEDARRDGLAHWARQQLSAEGQPPAAARLQPVSDDASFRRYFRFDSGAAGLVFVDAPPQHEDNPSYIGISKAISGAGLLCPQVMAADLAQGYMMVTDLGDQQYLPLIKEAAQLADQCHEAALKALAKLRLVPLELPPYDRGRLLEEMQLFDDWLLGRQLGIQLSAGQGAMLAEVRELLVANALAQPVVFVHRDYHARNLMALNELKAAKGLKAVDSSALKAANSLGPGILDFQDAVRGPLTYDLVSLLKDCYHRLPRQKALQWVDFYRQQTTPNLDQDTFVKWFDLMGVQRHLKCAGIFCRLHLRDGKPGYLGDLPLVIDYLLEAASLYPPLEPLGSLLTELVTGRLPELAQTSAKVKA